MTLRILGIIMISISCGCTGFLLAAAYRKEIKSLTSFIDMLNYFECELQYKSPPLADIFSNFSGTRRDVVSAFCNQLAQELDAQICPNVQACVQVTLKKSNDIPLETSKLLSKLGISLGKFDMDGQLLEIKSLRDEAQFRLEHLLSDQENKTKNYKTLGLCAGTAIAILLI